MKAYLDIDGWEAMRLWERYRENHGLKALKTFLDYNRDDVINLPMLEKTLCP